MKRSLSATLIVLMCGGGDPGPPAERTRNPNQAGELSTPKRPSCQPADEPSYGTTIPGMWLEELFVEMAAPGGHQVTHQQVRDTGTALWIEIPAYEDALTLYATLISRPFPVNEDWDAPEREIERRGDFTIYFTTGDFPWESFVARDPEWQLALLAYAAKGQERIKWPDGVRKWLRAGIEEIEHSPPDCEPGADPAATV